VAHSMFNNKDGKNNEQLQEYLAMTQRGIVGTTFEPIFTILNNSRKLLGSPLRCISSTV
jgi:hypothetical protein